MLSHNPLPTVTVLPLRDAHSSGLCSSSGAAAESIHVRQTIRYSSTKAPKVFIVVSIIIRASLLYASLLPHCWKTDVFTACIATLICCHITAIQFSPTTNPPFHPSSISPFRSPKPNIPSCAKTIAALHTTYAARKVP